MKNTETLDKIEQFITLRSEINEIPFYQMFKIWIAEFVDLMHKHKISSKKKAFICNVSNSDTEGINFKIFVDPAFKDESYPFKDESYRKSLHIPSKNVVVDQNCDDHIYCDLLIKIYANTGIRDFEILSDNNSSEFEKEVLTLQKKIDSIVSFLRQDSLIEEYETRFDKYFLVFLEGETWKNQFIHSILPISEMKASQSIQLYSREHDPIEIDSYHLLKCLVFKFFNRTVILYDGDLSEIQDKFPPSSEELKIMQLYADRVFIRNEML